MEQPIIEFKDMTVTSKKVKVSLYPDRIERTSENAWPSKKSATTSIPLRTVSSVSSESDGMAFQKVKFASGGGEVVVKLKKKDAEKLVEVVRPLIG